MNVCNCFSLLFFTFCLHLRVEKKKLIIGEVKDHCCLCGLTGRAACRVCGVLHGIKRQHLFQHLGGNWLGRLVMCQEVTWRSQSGCKWRERRRRIAMVERRDITCRVCKQSQVCVFKPPPSWIQTIRNSEPVAVVNYCSDWPGWDRDGEREEESGRNKRNCRSVISAQKNQMRQTKLKINVCTFQYGWELSGRRSWHWSHFRTPGTLRKRKVKAKKSLKALTVT